MSPNLHEGLSLMLLKGGSNREEAASGTATLFSRKPWRLGDPNKARKTPEALKA